MATRTWRQANHGNSNTEGLAYEVFPADQDDHGHQHWIAEAIDDESEGEIYTTIFCGSKAEERAKEYSALMHDGASS